ncbi:gas vesicle protein GvpL/GvpF [Actinophytocola oryzae]|uniref:Gas vesicle protein GvpL/GvpF n=2 Tax=Actinophytocola oryzae TaxID=502181 RepID=A0A4R7VYB5_9PSEU|nr:gas vesicle protein GvpL/GvpF [Actinophytocola oryzae]
MLDPAGPVDIRLVTHGGLALVVAEVELAPFAALESLKWAPSEDDPLFMLARRHDVVVRAIFEHHPVLPLRFGTTVPDETAAVALLTEHHAEASAWLDRVRDHREWGVRARFTPPDRPAEVNPEDLSHTEYMAVRRDRLAAAARARREGSEAASRLHEEVSRHATDIAALGRRASLLDNAYLVHRDAEADFHAATRNHEGIAVEVTGPWPPYSFVSLDVSAGAAAPAR